VPSPDAYEAARVRHPYIPRVKPMSLLKNRMRPSLTASQADTSAKRIWNARTIFLPVQMPTGACRPHLLTHRHGKN
jgi:hypothetical protein